MSRLNINLINVPKEKKGERRGPFPAEEATRPGLTPTNKIKNRKGVSLWDPRSAICSAQAAAERVAAGGEGGCCFRSTTSSRGLRSAFSGLLACIVALLQERGRAGLGIDFETHERRCNSASRGVLLSMHALAPPK